MLAPEIEFKSFLPPGIAKFGNRVFVIPGWHLIPENVTLEEVQKHWVKDSPTNNDKQDTEVHQIVKSIRTGEDYTVEYNGKFWSCTCVGYGYRHYCKHIDQVKLNITK
jgi:hypothetical protein